MLRNLGSDHSDILLLPCRATESSEYDVNSVSILSVLRGTNKFLEGIVSAVWSFGRVTVGEQHPL